MKKGSFFLGCGLVIGLIVTLGWLVVRVKAFTVTELTCTEADQPCPAPIADKLQTRLVGQSIFITDFELVLVDSEFRVAHFTKHLPGKLQVVVEQNQLEMVTSSQTATVDADPVKITATVTKLFADASLPVENIEVKPASDVVIVQLEKERALLRASQAELDAHKVILIKKHLRLSEIDTGIVEIDARYQMPVLRTSMSAL